MDSRASVLGNPSPNPFNPTTRIPYNLGTKQGKLKIYSINGQMVYQKRIKGSGVLLWEAKGLSSGIYILKAQIGNRRYSRKLVLQR
jgi:hypothetical protein